ncbi:MAG: hypothetical protein QOE73_716 [Verrucomicrobiota bacterium]
MIRYIYMKRYIIAAVTIALSVLALEGCANQQTPANASDADPTKKTYTREDLDRSGRAQTGQALQQIDPNIQSRSR